MAPGKKIIHISNNQIVPRKVSVKTLIAFLVRIVSFTQAVIIKRKMSNFGVSAEFCQERHLTPMLINGCAHPCMQPRPPSPDRGHPCLPIFPITCAHMCALAVANGSSCVGSFCPPLIWNMTWPSINHIVTAISAVGALSGAKFAPLR